MKKQRKHEQSLPRSVMEARAAEYEEEGLSDYSEKFLTPHTTILKGYMNFTYARDLKPRLRVLFTARYSFGRPEIDPRTAPRSESKTVKGKT